MKKKFKDKKFVAGYSRDVMKNGSKMIDWELDELLESTLQAMKSLENS